ncbi:hypothetical protein HHI36_007893 [Cryptolaemus montrouzieri]|uniref:Uncharacterized protein n=1 Tax=Cryptolaemus montrouzieri TaxID=559131 RepID=A0ABD2MR68_9CUCU
MNQYYFIRTLLELKNIVEKGLVVRIGRDNSSAKHMVCSRTTTNQNSSNTTTTTKITIDLSPTEDQENQRPLQNAKQNGSHSFKSTSLILNTIKSKNEPEKLEEPRYGNAQLLGKPRCEIPQQLEALKRLYEDNSDSDADKEVQLLTSGIVERDLEKMEDDNSSVVSGSWSRMRAYKNVFDQNNHKRTSDVASSRHAQIEKDMVFEQSHNINQMQREEPVKIKANIRSRKYSPIVLRKHPTVIKSAELRTANASQNLSSPLLVGRSYNDVNIDNSPKKMEKTSVNENVQKETQIAEGDTFVKNERVLRQPKKSELAYFGVQVSAHEKSKNITNQKETTETKVEKIRNTKISHQKTQTARSASPIYENISPTPIKSESRPVREFDSDILDELTKAADEILQAVKDYSEEESRKQKKEEEKRIELTTITENKSWKHQEKTSKPVERPCKSKLRNASSNSSLETSPKDAKSAQRYISNTKASAEKMKTKTTSSESSGAKATTKARRLQRASSREALLQAQGSSSEDLTANEVVPLRKPRLVRKTKTTTLTISNGIEINKKNTVSSNAKRKTESSTKTKPEDRLPSALPEIRHKTAISTIKSTAEKAIRDRSKHQGDESKKKMPQYKEIMKASPSSMGPMKSKREAVTHKLATAYVPACSRSHRKMHAYEYYENQDQCPCLCS